MAFLNILNENKNCELDNLASEIDKYHYDNAKLYQAATVFSLIRLPQHFGG